MCRIRAQSKTTFGRYSVYSRTITFIRLIKHQKIDYGLVNIWKLQYIRIHIYREREFFKKANSDLEDLKM